MSKALICTKCGSDKFEKFYKFFDVGKPSTGVAKMFSDNDAYWKASVNGETRLVADLAVVRCIKCHHEPSNGGFRGKRVR